MDAYAKLIEDDAVRPEPKYKIGDKLKQKLSIKSIFTIINIYESELVEGLFLYDLKFNEPSTSVWSRVDENRIDKEFIRLED